MQHTEGIGRRASRIAVEFAVIVAGVLVALAADRWNQARSDRVAEAAYLARFIDEIADDSASAAAYLEDRPTIIAHLDSLIAFVDGSAPPSNLAQAVLIVSNELSLPPVVAWAEIQASNSLDLVRDPDVRAALTTYYGRRQRTLLLWTRQDSRARDPLWNELYRTGLFAPTEDFGVPPALDAEIIRTWPGIRELLVALGTGHYFQRFNAESVQSDAGVILERLRRVE